MAERRDEVQTAMDPCVVYVLPIDTALILEILAKLFVDVVFYCPPTERNHLTFLSSFVVAHSILGWLNQHLTIYLNKQLKPCNDN